METPAEATSEPSAPPEGPETEALARALALEPGVARSLRAAGLATADAVRAASDETLHAAGLSDDAIARLRSPPPVPAAGAAPAPSAAVEKWMQSVRHSGRARRTPHPASATKGSTDVLRKWVDGDDRALESWISSSEGLRPGPVPPVIPGAPVPVSPEPRSPPSPTPAGGPAPALAGGMPANLVEREETVVRWLTDLLDRVKTDHFDPNSMLQEFQELQRGLYDEREKRRQLEEQLEHVKRGSIAVIKYVRTREAAAREELIAEKDAEVAEIQSKIDALIARASAAGAAAPSAIPEAVRGETENRLRAELAAREEAFAEREGELRRRVVELEGEVRTLRTEAETRVETRRSGSGPEAPTAAAVKAHEDRERELLRRENDLRTRLEEIRIRTDELERRREAVNFKEHEVTEREQDLGVRTQALEVELKRVEAAKRSLPAMAAAAGADAETLAATRRLEALEQEIVRREKELTERENFLTHKLAEVEELQKKAVDQEAERLHSEATVEPASAKLRTGIRRLDDLLFGGVPPGSQVLVNGPAHTGKDVLARLFVAEGLRTGQGALWMITDRTYTTVRDEMTALLSNYPEYERRGLVRYIDLYSRSLGVTEAERGVKLLASNDKALLEQLTSAANAFAGELKDKAPTYRVVFESVSTITAYLDSSAMFRFLQPLIGRRKMDSAAGFYELETGMHTDSDLQTLEHMMDGSINLKVEQLKTFLSVRGLTDVQSRAWVGYTFSKKAFSLGSFSLDHIR
jgi:KaiC/GvpD/RAD55 family RecA-like ATPase